MHLLNSALCAPPLNWNQCLISNNYHVVINRKCRVLIQTAKRQYYKHFITTQLWCIFVELYKTIDAATPAGALNKFSGGIHKITVISLRRSVFLNVWLICTVWNNMSHIRVFFNLAYRAAPPEVSHTMTCLDCVRNILYEVRDWLVLVYNAESFLLSCALGNWQTVCKNRQQGLCYSDPGM